MKGEVTVRRVPRYVRDLPLGARIKWARTTTPLSHDRLVEKIGRSNRAHLINIEKGRHIPKPDLRDAIADATGVPRSLFDGDDEEEAELLATKNLEDLLLKHLRRAVKKEMGQ